MFGVMVKGGVRGELCKYWDIKLIFHAAGRYEYRCRAGGSLSGLVKFENIIFRRTNKEMQFKNDY